MNLFKRCLLQGICCLALGLLISGCATIDNSQDLEIQQLRGRIDFLEEEVRKERDENLLLSEELSEARLTAEELVSQEDIERIVVKIPTATQIQTALKNAGFYQGKIDGVIGPKTKEAIRNFQKAKGLSPDGTVGSKTWDNLAEYLNLPEEE
ncbi:MAG: peptidoglycan-binding protein [Candidatus Omnitrophica bacterium]|nr:peptidoglycan-binding protein [Candidatus Omnitrophota bacterium]